MSEDIRNPATVRADASVKELLYRLHEIPKQGYAFGHQDSLAYGVGWKNKTDEFKSDVVLVTNRFPAVFGFDLGNLELGKIANLDGVNFNSMRKYIQQIHTRGGIVTMSWHPDHPSTGNSYRDTTPIVPQLLRGGKLQLKFQNWLGRLGEFFNSLKTVAGESIPIIFRPFHEMNGNWFWWGRSSCSTSEYQQLWQETFEFLTLEMQVYNLLYCYSPDVVKDENDYLKNYPGDAYVDMLGIDLYHKFHVLNYPELLHQKLTMLSKVANDKKMPYALTEVGLDRLNKKDWWTRILDPNISSSGISWALFWRNDSKKHHFVPYPGHKHVDDFIRYTTNPHVLFLEDLTNRLII